MQATTTLLFDFDGTIADTFKEVIKIYNKMAPSLNCKPVDENDIKKLKNIRPQDFMNEYKISKSKLPILLLRGRKMLKHKIETIQPFDNLISILQELKAHNYQLGILSSNSKENIRKFLAFNEIEHMFDFIYNGKNIFGKSNKIKQILKEQNLKNNQVLMIGDETRDIEAAHKSKVDIIAVTWGFNGSEALKKLCPKFIAHQPSELLAYLKSRKH